MPEGVCEGRCEWRDCEVVVARATAVEAKPGEAEGRWLFRRRERSFSASGDKGKGSEGGEWGGGKRVGRTSDGGSELFADEEVPFGVFDILRSHDRVGA